jgi:ribose transport system ATP-binding protein
VPERNSEVILELRNITKVFPGVKALDNVDFDLRKGEVHVLVGENGAGKSTLMKVLSGVHQPDGGEIRLRGKQVEISSPRGAQDLGISMIYQEFNLVPFLSVASNIYLGREPTRLGLIDHRTMHKRTTELLESVGMDIKSQTLIKDLGIAKQQLVEVAKALSLDCDILIMDEPTAALGAKAIEQLFEIIRRLKDKGISVIYISHRLEELAQIGDRVTVIRDGKRVGCSPMSDVKTEDIICMMVGDKICQMFPRDIVPKGEQALNLVNISRKDVLHDVSLEIHCGEIVGLGGVMGSGRTELAEVVFGEAPFDGGEMYLFGQRVRRMSPVLAVSRGLGFLPEDRKQKGLALDLRVRENVLMSSLNKVFPNRIINSKIEKDLVKRFVDDLNIATPSINRFVKYLSGGNQQKVVIAKWLCTRSRFFIFDEPTRGIDVGAKVEVHKLMNELVKNGAAVLMISSELPELVNMSDRIYIMYRGTIVKELGRDETTKEEVLRYETTGGKDRAIAQG